MSADSIYEMQFKIYNFLETILSENLGIKPVTLLKIWAATYILLELFRQVNLYICLKTNNIPNRTTRYIIYSVCVLFASMLMIYLCLLNSSSNQYDFVASSHNFNFIYGCALIFDAILLFIGYIYVGSSMVDINLSTKDTLILGLSTIIYIFSKLGCLIFFYYLNFNK